jgi:hypothetical protein
MLDLRNGKWVHPSQILLKPQESPANPKSKQGTCLNPKKTTISAKVIYDQITCQRN